MNSSVMPTYNRIPLDLTHGEGSWLYERDGRRFLDFISGIAVNALGHAHPELVKTLEEQAHKLWHVSNLFTINEQEVLADKLCDKTFADHVFFTNSGTEAAEMAIKMARKWGGERHKILTFTGAFHGRSTGAIAAVGSEKMTAGFGPLMPGFVQITWGDMDAISQAAAEPDVAAIMVEPIVGEGGIKPLGAERLQQLRALCDAHNLLLIFDEVQCGVGRSGHLFAHEASGITPDIMMVAKGIGGGFPLGAVLATKTASAPMQPGTHGSTYGGNPLACAVGAKVIDIVSQPDFLADVNVKSEALRHGLQQLLQAHPDVFEEVRGEGLMLGLQCVDDPSPLVAAARAQGLLLVTAAENTIRVLPPLNVTHDEIDTALTMLEAAASQYKTNI